MLVLSRKENEGICIGSDIWVTVLSVEGDKVRLGIQAPKSVRVFREELMRETGAENRMALQSPVVTFDLSSARGCAEPERSE